MATSPTSPTSESRSIQRSKRSMCGLAKFPHHPNEPVVVSAMTTPCEGLPENILVGGVSAVVPLAIVLIEPAGLKVI